MQIDARFEDQFRSIEDLKDTMEKLQQEIQAVKLDMTTNATKAALANPSPTKN